MPHESPERLGFFERRRTQLEQTVTEESAHV